MQLLTHYMLDNFAIFVFVFCRLLIFYQYFFFNFFFLSYILDPYQTRDFHQTWSRGCQQTIKIVTSKPWVKLNKNINFIYNFHNSCSLTLKAPIKTTADDKFGDIFSKLKIIRYDISWELSASRRFSWNIMPNLLFLKKSSKIWRCRLLQIIGGALVSWI